MSENDSPPVGDAMVGQQLDELRRLTSLTGRVHEAQQYQLSMWPRVVFPVAELRVDVDEPAHDIVFTMLLSDDLPKGKDLKLRIQALERWTRQLLGPDWAIRIVSRRSKGAKTRCVYKGERAQPVKSEATPPRLENAPLPDPVTTFRRYRVPSSLGFDDAAPLEPILPVKR